MYRIVLAAVLVPVLYGCAGFTSVGYVDLPDGSRLKAMEYQSDTAIGTDINYVLVYHCPAQELGLRCKKAGEFGGSSASFLKSLFQGGAAGAAIGAGIAVQDFEGDSVSVEGTSSATSKSKAAAASKSKAAATSKSISSSKVKGGAVTINQPATNPPRRRKKH